jgi:hypothetical protein
MIDEPLKRNLDLGQVPQLEFEMLLGLGISTLDRLLTERFTTRECSILETDAGARF